MSTHRRIRTEEGTTAAAFGAVEWGLLSSVALLWGASSPLIAEALESTPPGTITTLRLALGFLALSLFPVVRTPIDRSDMSQLVLLSFVWMSIPFTLFPIAQQWINSATAGMLNGAMPMFAALFASLLLRRLPGRTQMVGLVVGFGGVVLISTASRGQTASSLQGVALILIATTCYGLAINLAVPLQQRYGALPVLWRALGIATLTSVPYALFTGFAADFRTDSGEWHLTGVLAVLTLGLLGTGFAFVAMANLAGRTGGTRAATTVYVIPVVAMVIGVVFRNDDIRPAAVVGIALVLSGAGLMSRRDRTAADR